MDQTVLSRRVRKKKRRRTVDQEVRRRKRKKRRTQMERGITQSNPSPDRKMKLLRTEE